MRRANQLHHESHLWLYCHSLQRERAPQVVARVRRPRRVLQQSELQHRVQQAQVHVPLEVEAAQPVAESFRGGELAIFYWECAFDCGLHQLPVGDGPDVPEVRGLLVLGFVGNYLHVRAPAARADLDALLKVVLHEARGAPAAGHSRELAPCGVLGTEEHELLQRWTPEGLSAHGTAFVCAQQFLQAEQVKLVSAF